MSPDLEATLSWVEERLKMGDVPRIIDIVAYAKENGLKVSRKEITANIQLNPTYLFNMDFFGQMF